MYSEQQPERKTALNAPIKIDADALVRAKAERAKLTVAVSPDGKALFECLHAGKTYDEESPIALAGTEARVYLRDGQWIVGIPTKLSGLPERRIPIDIEQNPDQAVYEILKNYQNWDINTVSVQLVGSKEGE